MAPAPADPPPPSGTAPVTPLPSVGPQAWLAEAVGNLPAAPETAPLPGPPPPPLVTARRRKPPLGLVVAGVLALALAVAGGLAAAGLSGAPAGGGAGATEEAADGGGTAVAGAGAAPALQPVSVRATCQAPPSADSLGNTTTYGPELTLDAVGATAWRCPGVAVGQQLVYDFGAPVTVTSVGLVPGYAKVDSADGTDRFLENRTVTEVTWRFDDGSAHRQSIASPSPAAADLELPGGVRTRQVVLEIAGTGNDTAVRDFTAISDVRFAGY
ncbi:NADase-type glycan-binding domain-containing protein [Blastococcus sp. SYSU DS0533]